MLMSPHFQHNVKWWQGHINYKNTKTRRFELTPFQLFTYTTPDEKKEFFDTDGEGGCSPGTLRYDRVGAPNHCRDMTPNLPDRWRIYSKFNPSTLLYIAYSRPILRTTIERCPLLQKLSKALF